MEKMINRALLVQCSLSHWGDQQFNISVSPAYSSLLFWHKDGFASELKSLGWVKEPDLDGQAVFRNKDYPCVKVIICRK